MVQQSYIVSAASQGEGYLPSFLQRERISGGTDRRRRRRRCHLT